MPTPRQYNVAFSFFPYGGNGAAPSEHPAIRRWWGKTCQALTKNPLVRAFDSFDYADTPITMTRNRAVYGARKAGADILFMIDSDMVPDLYLNKEYAVSMGGAHVGDVRPFVDTAIEYIDSHYEKGPTVIVAPYCGPPPEEAPYLFTWESYPSGRDNPNIRLRMFTRKEACEATGIGEVAALPTGLIAFDLRVFDHCEPKPGDKNGWFYYEYSDQYQMEKSGTEDVMCTRDLSLAVQRDLGYNPLRCAWDCWAGHVKPTVVGKPIPVYLDKIEERFRRAVQESVTFGERVIEVGLDQPLGENGPPQE